MPTEKIEFKAVRGDIYHLDQIYQIQGLLPYESWSHYDDINGKRTDDSAMDQVIFNRYVEIKAEIKTR